MGRFTGKSDFEDMVLMHYSPQDILKAKIYQNKSRLKLETERDLIPYYPYLISVMSATKKEDGSSDIVIEICNKSYIDTREEETIFYVLQDILLFKKQCNKKKLEFNKQAFEKSKFYYEPNKEIVDKIFNVLDKREDTKTAFNFTASIMNNKKENRDFVDRVIWLLVRDYFPIHLDRYNRIRKDLLEYAAENGWGDFYKKDVKSLSDLDTRFLNNDYNPVLINTLIKTIQN